MFIVSGILIGLTLYKGRIVVSKYILYFGFCIPLMAQRVYDPNTNS